MVRTLLTLAVGTAGGGLASLVGLPSPWLLGALFAVLAASGCKVPVYMPASTTTWISLFVGVSIASSIEADIFEHISDWYLSIVMMIVMLGLVLTSLYYFYRFRCGWSGSDALLCSVPGNLAVVLIFAAQAKLSVKRIALVHSVRLFFLVSVLPLLFPVVDRQSNGLAVEVAYTDLALVFVGAGVVGGVFRKLKVPAGMLVGAMAGALVLKFGLGVEPRIPTEWFRAVLVLLGTATAVRMAGLDLALLRQTIFGAVGGLTLALSICAMFSLVLYFCFDVPLLQALLSYMPGGIEVMVAIAFSTDVDPIFVATHQLLRVLIMCFALPLLFRALGGDGESKPI
ncbi:AbrB family transcriptional regulator [Marinobacterium sp. YM272]|uniref:AbrB family transcriptional regulator n=1 Tax=Marinobacterium sp. YM272 TaxID=3421654 RepID=UPI003D7F479B